MIPGLVRGKFVVWGTCSRHLFGGHLPVRGTPYSIPRLNSVAKVLASHSEEMYVAVTDSVLNSVAMGASGCAAQSVLLHRIFPAHKQRFLSSYKSFLLPPSKKKSLSSGWLHGFAPPLQFRYIFCLFIQKSSAVAWTGGSGSASG